MAVTPRGLKKTLSIQMLSVPQKAHKTHSNSNGTKQEVELQSP